MKKCLCRLFKHESLMKRSLTMWRLMKRSLTMRSRHNMLRIRTQSRRRSSSSAAWREEVHSRFFPRGPSTWLQGGQPAHERHKRRLCRDVPTAKTRMLGLAPSIFSMVDPLQTPKQVFGDPQNIYIDARGGRRQIKKSVSFRSDL